MIGRTEDGPADATHAGASRAHALYPGQHAPACTVHLRGVSPGDREVLAVHATCYPYEMKDCFYCWDRTPPMYTSVLVQTYREVFERQVSRRRA